MGDNGIIVATVTRLSALASPEFRLTFQNCEMRQASKPWQARYQHRRPWGNPPPPPEITRPGQWIRVRPIRRTLWQIFHRAAALCRNMFEHRHTGDMKPVVPQRGNPREAPNATVESAGQKLTSAVLADLEIQDLEPDAREVELLARAAKAADRIADLEAIVASEGETFRNKAGIVCPSPLLAEIRLQDGILMQALRGIKMEPAKTPAGKDAAKSRAGQASWRARQARAIPIGGIK